MSDPAPIREFTLTVNVEGTAYVTFKSVLSMDELMKLKSSDLLSHALELAGMDRPDLLAAATDHETWPVELRSDEDEDDVRTIEDI